jgi:dTMP kinase
MTGKIICFEGIDGAGKTTQALKLKQRLEERGHTVKYVKMGEGYLSQQIKEINAGRVRVPFSTRSLLYAANVDYIDKEVVRPSISAGDIVLLDRQYLTLIIYGTLRNKDQSWLENVNSKLAQPDITFVLLADPEEVARNRNKKITLFEVVKNDVKEGQDLVRNYIALQREVSDFYRQFIDDDRIIGVATAAGIDGTFAEIETWLRQKLRLNL